MIVAPKDNYIFLWDHFFVIFPSFAHKKFTVYENSVLCTGKCESKMQWMQISLGQEKEKLQEIE